MENQLRIVVVDDQELVRKGIIHMLSSIKDYKIVGEASSGEEAVDVVRGQNVDVVLMDIKMKGIGGLEATRRIIRVSPDTKVLVISTFDSNSLYPAKVMKAGAFGYITKSASFKEMLRAINFIKNSQKYISSEIASDLAIMKITEKDSSPFNDLSDKEFQVAVRVSKGETANSIAKDLFLSPKTVNSYRYRIFQKLSIQNDVELALMAIKYNLDEEST
jgi:two-component system, NarL family, invasion response regulator UvrY